jgi:hypothetical protein
MAMVANNLVTKTNALLNKHRIMAELLYTVQHLALCSKTKQLVNTTVKLPTATKLTAIDDDDV